jgi:precorrin-4/cobalt-precorrin-4 C11-methyltransferase
MLMIEIVGAGPGDPELLTLRAKRLLETADLVVWAGSLVNPAILEFAKPGAELVDSSTLTLEEIVARLATAHQAGLLVVRLHTGDPSLYGAIGEQIRLLAEQGIPCRITPGVSSFLAAAAALGIEYTVPELTQTVILTRIEGRTPVPEREALARLAKHNGSLCIFLSVAQLEKVVAELLAVLPPETPVAVVEKASWPEEKIISGCLEDIALKVRKAGITKTALIIVGQCLEASATRSRLYDGDFHHEYR